MIDFPSSDYRLRVCSYNIHKGFSATNIKPVLQDLRQAIREVDADLVFLQEVVGERLESVGKQGISRGPNNSYPQFEYLADEVWPHHAYGRNAIYQKGHHGNAILSKNPFLGWDNLDVSHWWFSQRGILFGMTDQGIYLVCVHFGLFAAERRKQLQQVLDLLAKQVAPEQPVIIAGDFNDWTGEIHRYMTGELGYCEAYSDLHGRPARTFPARLPILAMDRIYYRNLKLIETEVLSGPRWLRLSDHRALYAEFSRLHNPE